MARPLRIEFPGAFYHVMHRGNGGLNIFKSKRDREKFLGYLGKAVKRYGLKIHTYCLMTNHYHLLVETPQANLSQAMKWINVSYAIYFNRKRQLTGHLFQGRFKSILIDADDYLTQLSRYIHLNPIRAGIVDHLKNYQWSSYPAFSGYGKATKWLKTHWLLSQFGNKKRIAEKRYRNFVETGLIEDLEKPSKDIIAGCILGDVDFVNWVKKNFLGKELTHKEIPQLKHLKPGLLLDDIIPTICDEYNCDQETIRRKGKKKNMARDVAIYLSRELTGESGVSLGRYFGAISGAGITSRYNVINSKIQTDKRFNQLINRIKKRIINN